MSLPGRIRPSGTRRLAGAALAGLALASLPTAASAAEGGGIAALGFNLPGLAAQLINFLILLIVLRLFLYRPVLRVLEERRNRIEQGLSQADRAAEQAAASEAEARRIAELAQVQGREAIQRAQEAADRLRGELEERARQEADQIVTRARQEVRAERDRAIQQLHEQFADLTVTAAERVIGQSVDRSAHQRLIDEVLVSSELGDGAGASSADRDQP